MSSPEPYTISVPKERLDILKQKLSLTEFPDELENSRWDYGAPLADIKRLTKAWEQWDWRQAEERLNKFPQFHMDIDVDGFDTLDIHFIHQKNDNPDAIPLLFSHGWPGSFIEVTKLLPGLKGDSKSPAFHVVAPSLPNFGFSQGVSKKGFAPAQYAETCHKLMLKLGYDKYVTQGGDWGTWVTRAMGKLYPESVKASHLNMVLSVPPVFSKNPLLALQHRLLPYSEHEQKGLERRRWFSKEGRGYNLLQGSKPQTIAYALNDSPVALLAWIYEKLHDWTDSYPWTDDEILTWISIYWFSRAGPGAAGRIYYEHEHPGASGNPGVKNVVPVIELQTWIPHVKLGFTLNPKELAILPRTWSLQMGDVVYEAKNDHGGHFYAHEHPELLVRDLRAMFGKGGGAYEVIKGKSGYSQEERSRL